MTFVTGFIIHSLSKTSVSTTFLSLQIVRRNNIYFLLLHLLFFCDYGLHNQLELFLTYRYLICQHLILEEASRRDL